MSAGLSLARIWGYGFDPGTNIVAVHVSRLRAKLGLNTASTYRVMPVYGYGYRLDRLET